MGWRNIWPIYSKPSPSEAAHALGKVGRDRQRQKVREVADQMREAQGKPQWKWKD